MIAMPHHAFRRLLWIAAGALAAMSVVNASDDRLLETGPIYRTQSRVSRPLVDDAIREPGVASGVANRTELLDAWSTELRDPAEPSRAWRLVFRTREARLIAIERLQGGRAVEFKHLRQVQGEATWTDWMPIAVRAQGGWPDPADASFTSSLETDATVSSRIAGAWADARGAALLAPARDSSDEARHGSLLAWQPGQTTFKYDSNRWKPWAGYLWDFANGWLWRGYRTPSVPGEVLTPSQSQTDYDPALVRAYYTRLDANPAGSIKQYNENNSRWLSPLDKWGIWANRRFDQKWWQAHEWEATNHYRNHAWGGYCNASAAAAILWREPKKSFVDRKLRFDPRDMVGIMQIATYKTDLLWWGERYNGPANNVADPAPDLVISVLEQYLGRGGTPIVLDWEAKDAVGNVVVIGAKITLSPTGDARVLKGAMDLEVFGNFEDDPAPKADEATVQQWDPTGTMHKVFEFRAELNPNGSLRSTRWENPEFHPDFLWLPTGVQDYAAPHYKNPYLPMKYVNELIKKAGS